MQTKTRANWVYKKPVFLSLRRTFFFFIYIYNLASFERTVNLLASGKKGIRIFYGVETGKEKGLWFCLCREHWLQCLLPWSLLQPENVFICNFLKSNALLWSVVFFEHRRERQKCEILKVSSSSRSPWLVIFICFCFGPKNQVHLHHEVRWLRGGHPLPPLLIGQGL